MDRKEWDKIAGAAAIVVGIASVIVGASLVWYEDLVHLIQEPKGRR